jgi:hypothetical protein
MACREPAEGAASTEVERGGILGDHGAWRFMTPGRDCRGSSSSVGTVESTPAPVRRAAGAMPQAPAPEQGGQKLKHSPASLASCSAGPGAGDRGGRCILHCEGTGPEGSLPSPIGTVTATAQVQVQFKFAGPRAPRACPRASSPSRFPCHARAGHGDLATGNGQTAGDRDSASLPRLRVAREPWLLTGIDSRPPDV